MEGRVVPPVAGDGVARLQDVSKANHEALWGRQSFYRAVSLVNGGREQETDLFAALRD
jgi:hypothetical protein